MYMYVNINIWNNIVEPLKKKTIFISHLPESNLIACPPKNSWDSSCVWKINKTPNWPNWSNYPCAMWHDRLQDVAMFTRVWTKLSIHDSPCFSASLDDSWSLFFLFAFVVFVCVCFWSYYGIWNGKYGLIKWHPFWNKYIILGIGSKQIALLVLGARAWSIFIYNYIKQMVEN